MTAWSHLFPNKSQPSPPLLVPWLLPSPASLALALGALALVLGGLALSCIGACLPLVWLGVG